MISNRSVYKKVEPVVLVVQFTTGLTIRMDLVDPETGDVLLANRTMTEIDPVSLPGIYSTTFTPAQLDALTIDGQVLDEHLVLWKARPVPAIGTDPAQYGTFYRGGWVDQLEKMKGCHISFATVAIPERNVVKDAISHVDYPIGYEKLLRMQLFYRAGSQNPQSVVTSIVDASGEG